MVPLALASAQAFTLSLERVLEPAALRAALESRIEGSAGEERRAWLGLRRMYADRRFEALWVGDEGGRRVRATCCSV